MVLPAQSCLALEPYEEEALHKMRSGQAHQACQLLMGMLGAPQGPQERVIFLFFFFLFCPRQTNMALHMGQYCVAKTTQDTAQLYLMM